MSNGKPWTEKDTATMIRLHAKGATDGVIAAEIGHSLNTVGDRRRAMLLPKNHPALYAPWEAIPAMSRRAIARACAKPLTS